MENLTSLIILLAMLGVVFSLVGIVKGNVKFLKISSRKQAAKILLCCFILIFLSSSIQTPDQETVSENPNQSKVTTKKDDLEKNIEDSKEETNKQEESNKQEGTEDTLLNKETQVSETIPVENHLSTEQLKIHYINVGQADSILIENGTSAMLIDAGNNDDSGLVINYIKKQGINKLDFVIGTHPHEDHIGGLDKVINTFDVGKIFLPKITHTTDTFNDVITAISNKGLKISTPIVGSSFKIGNANTLILAPNGSRYDDLNNYSIVIKLTYGETSFLFMGDAEKLSEEEIINKDFDLLANVIKLGHHGSNSSSSTAFLNKVNPKYAIIMVGQGNDYGHPHKETMDKLKNKGIKVYRTDQNGSIIVSSNGKDIIFNTEPGNYNAAPTTIKAEVPTKSTGNTTENNTNINATGNGLIKGNINSKGEKIYHMPGGAYYDRTIPEVWFSTEEEAQAAGFRKSKR